MDASGNQIAITGGLIIGIVLGATIQRSNFCMMGAVADYAVSGDPRRLRAWMLTIALAIAGTQALIAATGLDLSDTVYLDDALPLLSILLGGILFGFGMVIACGCASRNLVNLATGDLRALIALLFMGIFAYATLRGLLAYPRLWIGGAMQPTLTDLGIDGQDVPALLRAAGLPGPAALALAIALCAGPLLLFALKPAARRTEPSLMAAAPIIAACIIAGWGVTGILAVDEFEPVPVGSLRFVAPVADSLQYLMTFTGAHATFGIASVGGVLLGAWGSAMTTGSFSWRAFEDLHDFRRYTLGGALMGVGGVLCLGCTVGQGLTGVSTLSVGSFIALASIIAGGILGIRYLQYGSLLDLARTLVRRGA